MSQFERIKKKCQHPSVWAFVTYFAEGFPYSVVHYISSLFFTYNNVKLEFLGLTSLYHIPWNFKFLWSTLFDQFGTKKKWIVLVEIGLLITSIILAVVSALPSGLKIAAVLFLVMAFLSASHDIAIDGYYLEKLDSQEQAKWVGFRAMAYRIAMLVASSGIVFLAGIRWNLAFWACAVIILLLLIYNYAILPQAEKETRKLAEIFSLLFKLKPILLILSISVLIFFGKLFFDIPFIHEVLGKLSVSKKISISMIMFIIVLLAIMPIAKKKIYTSDSFFAKSFINLIDQPRILNIILFIILYRLGETLLLSMKTPFFKGIGITIKELSIINGIFGTVATIAGALIGGYLISRFSLKKVIWPLILSQNLLNLLYMFVAMFYSDIYFSGDIAGRPLHMASASVFIVCVVLSVEALGAGMGTAGFMVYIMRCVKKSYKASHTAFWTAIMSISVLLTGPISGILASNYGFSIYFGLTFLSTIPGMVLIFFIPYLDEKTAQDLEEV